MGAEPRTLAAGNSEVNAHWPASASASARPPPPPGAPPPSAALLLFFYCNCSVIFQPSCKFLKLFTATEVLQILYNSVNVL